MDNSPKANEARSGADPVLEHDSHECSNEMMSGDQGRRGSQIHPNEHVDINIEELDKMITESINERKHFMTSELEAVGASNEESSAEDRGGVDEDSEASVKRQKTEAARDELEKENSSEHPADSHEGAEHGESTDVGNFGHDTEEHAQEPSFELIDHKQNYGQDTYTKNQNEEVEAEQSEDVSRENNEDVHKDTQQSEAALNLALEKAIQDGRKNLEESISDDKQYDTNKLKDPLHAIADEFHDGSSSSMSFSKEPQSEKETADENNLFSSQLNVPANSELFNPNSALAAYNAISAQAPSVTPSMNLNSMILPLPIVAADYLPPRIQLLINTLPVLDNLATQLLRVISDSSYQKVLDLAARADTPAGAAYRDLTSLFEFTKKLYSEEDPFLNVEHIAPGMWKEGDKTPSIFRAREQSIESALRKVNLATFLGATLGTIEVGFFYLNESFLDIFCPANSLNPSNSLSNMSPSNSGVQSGFNTAVGDRCGRLFKPQASLYLNLKTQAYISAVEADERSREEILNDILPDNLTEMLSAKRRVKTLSPSELEFIEQCKIRKDLLLSYPPTKDLSEEFEWISFLKELIEYAAKNMSFLVWGRKGRTTTRDKGDEAKQTEFASSENDQMTGGSFVAQQDPSLPSAASNDTDENKNQDISDITSALLPSEILEQQIHLRINPNRKQRSLQRRPWTREEEKALRHALELKGPSWSTILELFGSGGKISEALKNRSQVQLKDKARNWKMFFLKAGLPVPSYLQKVTGDLDRDDRSKSSKRATRNKKTAAAPVPPPVSSESRS
ncbi:Piso0_004655 [Millerozyma farinosa CBS 7064]|uniref:Piso0_004655 protein n=1 Tax=Pichia sorbitophila (strain ATCC MYA-4447 / BCRC 22081 / CBS 7064 / NBRC 10061 / NRRL Y-12695) TaxID=559304 RepID=G8Y623_PICSO|nr:Piso0_004655 [Millerozyma farinosa CBS 7064]CCE85084.1 Piso0_004655 [Millerozyma farinosa CBS 7064]